MAVGQSIRKAVLAVCASLAADCAMSESCGAESDEALKSLIANVAANEAIYANLEVVVRREMRSLRPPEELSDHVLRKQSVQTRCIYQGGKLYFKRESESKTGEGDFSITSVLGFDGQTTRSTEGNVANVQVDQHDPPDLIRPHTLLLLHNAWIGSVRLSEYLSQRRSASDFFYDTRIDGREMVGDLETVRLRVETWSDGQEERDFRYVWLALDRNYLPIKTAGYAVGYSREVPLDEGAVTRLEEIQPGIWFPMSVEDSVNSPLEARAGRRTPISTTTISVEKTDLNPHYEDSLFAEIPIPENATVYDVSATGEAQPRPASGESDADAGEEAPTPRSRFWILWINLLALCVVLAAMSPPVRKAIRRAFGSRN